jgi:hypothetical protein
MQIPNIFQFATSELSQDAVFCWLAICAEDSVENSELQTTGRAFLKMLLATKNIELPERINKIKVRRQYKKIDIVIELNGSIAIFIEDKVGTSEHSDQLKKYVAIAEKDFPNHRRVFIYIQTHIQPFYTGVNSAGFVVIERTQLLNILPETPNDSLLLQFQNHLTRIHHDFESFQFGKEWSFRAWQQYLQIISDAIDGCRWDYVSNPRGGF